LKLADAASSAAATPVVPSPCLRSSPVVVIRIRSRSSWLSGSALRHSSRRRRAGLPSVERSQIGSSASWQYANLAARASVLSPIALTAAAPLGI
jgi:hypothetical protein